MNTTIKHSLLIGLICAMMCTAQAQKAEEPKRPEETRTFLAAVIVGGNGAQIDGDKMLGFRKLGVVAGGRASFIIKKHWQPIVEILYAQKGSASEISPNELQTRFWLDYVEVPVMMSYIDQGLELSLGASYGRLLRTRIIINGLDEPDRTAEYKKDDISFTGGVGYFINKHIGFDMRFTKSLLDILKEENTFPYPQRNRLVSVRALWRF